MDPYGPPGLFEEMMMLVAPAFVFGVFVFVAVFFAILLSGRRLISRMKPGSGAFGAFGIVQERYARGELSRREFESMRSVLEGSPQPSSSLR